MPTNENTPNTIDMTPTWVGLLPMLVHVAHDGITMQARKDAMAELRRLAAAVDELNAKKKANPWHSMTPSQQHDTVINMGRRGGSFARSIAHAFSAADSSNTARPAAAFPELVTAYAPSQE